MEMIPVTSSNIAKVGYDIEKQLMEIEFSNKTKYSFSHVPQDVFEALLHAPSIGKYFAHHIRNNKAYGFFNMRPTLGRQSL